MRIVEPYAKMLNCFDLEIPEFRRPDGVCMLRRVEYYARISHASEDAMTPDSWDRFLRSVVLEHGDWSVAEHEKVTCEFLVDRGITHEIVRHRIGSYTQESTRFINYKKRGGEAKFVAPQPLSTATTEDELYAAEFIEDCEDSERRYMRALDRGMKPQIARGKLNHHVASKIVVTYNLRSWRHFFIMRTSAEAHPQMRQVVDPLLAEFQRNIPILYEDIEPGRRQRRAMEAAR